MDTLHSIKAIPPFIIQSSYLLLPCLPCSFVPCLPCFFVSSCSQQLTPGWSLSCLAGTANLHIVPFIRLAPTHNKTPLTRSLKSAVRTQCDWVMIAFEWASMNALIYFLLLASWAFASFFPLLPLPSGTPGPLLVGCSLSQFKWTHVFYISGRWATEMKGEWKKCIKSEFSDFPSSACLFLLVHLTVCVVRLLPGLQQRKQLTPALHLALCPEYLN